MEVTRLAAGERALKAQARIRLIPIGLDRYGWSCELLQGLLFVSARHRGEYLSDGAAEEAALQWAQLQGAISATVELAGSQRNYPSALDGASVDVEDRGQDGWNNLATPPLQADKPARPRTLS